MQFKKEPLLTVFVSVYNLENYVEQCLDSILAQDFEDYELLLVDNGSTDKSIDICNKYAEKYTSKIKYVKFPLPTIIGRAYNYAVRNLNGQYFMCVDGDDYIADGALRKIADKISLKKTDLILGTFDCVVEDGASPFSDAKFNAELINTLSYDDVLSYLADLPQFHLLQWRFIVSKRIIQQLERNIDSKHEYLDLSDISNFSDLVTTLIIFDKANSICFLEEPFYIYRCRVGSLSSKPFLNDKAVGYLSSLIELDLYSERGFPEKESTNYLIASQMKRYCNLYVNLSHTITANGYSQLSTLIKKYRNYFFNLRKYNVQCFNQICDFIEQHGELQGLMLFSKLQEANLLDEIYKSKGKKIFIFPTGICCESTAVLLKKWGIDIQGLLDNNAAKENMIFQNLPCFLPDSLSLLNQMEKNNTIVIISTAYETLIPVLKNQLQEIGIPCNNIIIR